MPLLLGWFVVELGLAWVFELRSFWVGRCVPFNSQQNRRTYRQSHTHVLRYNSIDWPRRHRRGKISSVCLRSGSPLKMSKAHLAECRLMDRQLRIDSSFFHPNVSLCGLIGRVPSNPLSFVTQESWYNFPLPPFHPNPLRKCNKFSSRHIQDIFPPLSGGTKKWQECEIRLPTWVPWWRCRPGPCVVPPPTCSDSAACIKLIENMTHKQRQHLSAFLFVHGWRSLDLPDGNGGCFKNEIVVDQINNFQEIFYK